MSTVRTVESEFPASVTTVEQVQSPVQLPTVGGGAVYYDTPVRDTPAEQSLAAAVVVRAEDRVKLDSTDYYQNKILQEITASIETKFGVKKSSLTTDKEEAGDVLKFEHVQISATHLFEKLQQVVERLVKYDMINIMTLYEIKSYNASLPIYQVLYVEDESKVKALHENWHDFTYDQIRFQQRLLNTSRFVRSADQNASNLLYKLLVNSCTHSLKEAINQYFDVLAPEEQGGLTYMWLLLNHIFRQTPALTKSLINVLTLWQVKGPAAIFGAKGNFKIGLKYLTNSTSLLLGSRDLPSDTVRKILEGGSKSKNKLLSSLSEKKLLELDESRLGLQALCAETPPQESIYDDVKKVLFLFDQVHFDETTTKEWEDKAVGNPQNLRINVAGDIVCWNCEKLGCNARTCKEKRDPARIKRNKDAFLKKKNARMDEKGKSRTIHQRTNHGSGGSKKVGNVLLTYCKHCGEFRPDHSTKYHDQWEKDKDSFNICEHCPTHPLANNVSAPPASNSSGAGASNDSIDVPKVKALLSKLEKQVSTEENVQIVNALRANFR